MNTYYLCQKKGAKNDRDKESQRCLGFEIHFDPSNGEIEGLKRYSDRQRERESERESEREKVGSKINDTCLSKKIRFFFYIIILLVHLKQ